MDSEALKKEIEAKISKLPSLPTVVAELIRVINHPNSSANDAERLLANDVSLSGQILKLANSSYYGIPQTIASVRNAVVLLGFNTIKSLILSSGIISQFPSNDPHSLFNKKIFWYHSVEVAIIAKSLVTKLNLKLDNDTMFTAGLLHDIGKLVLEKLYPIEYPEVLRKINEEYTPWQMAEGDTIELEHPLTGSVLLETWGVPIAVRDPIIYHLNPTESKLNPQAAHLLHYADYLSRLRGNNCVEGEPEPYLDPATRTTLGLPEDDNKIIELLKTEFENASEFFELIRSEG